MTTEKSPGAPAGALAATPIAEVQYTARVAQRRRDAALRLPPLGSCGCVRDPVHDRHRCGTEVSDHQAEAAASAIDHLDRHGLPALVDTSTCRALWRNGFRRLATTMHERTGGAA